MDLDPGQGDIVPTGCVAAAPVNLRCVDPERGWKNITPITYFSGFASPADRAPVYSHHCGLLAQAATERALSSDVARISGMVINTPGWVDDQGYKLLLDQIAAFDPDVVLVTGYDRLFAALKQDVPTRASGTDAEKLHIIKFLPSGGVVERSSVDRRQARANRTREYFYGPSGDWTPHSIPLDWKRIQVANVGARELDPELLPVGTDYTFNPLRATAVEPEDFESLVGKVLGVSLSPDLEHAADYPVAGFVHVQEIDVAHEKLVVLAPNSDSLPSSILIVGGVSWEG